MAPGLHHQGPRHIHPKHETTRRGAESCPEWELRPYTESEDPNMIELPRYPVNAKYRTGRRMMLAATVMFAITHTLGYLPTAEPRNLPIHWTSITTFIPAWVWASAWAVVVVLALIELFRGTGRRAISLTVGLMYAVAAAYLASYINTVLTVGWGSREWFYVGLYVFGGLIIKGLLTKVGALKQEDPGDDE